MNAICRGGSKEQQWACCSMLGIVYFLCSHTCSIVPLDFIYEYKFKDKLIKKFKTKSEESIRAHMWSPSEQGSCVTAEVALPESGPVGGDAARTF